MRFPREARANICHFYRQMLYLTEYPKEELEKILEDWGVPAFHAEQIFSWVYQKGVVDFGLMGNLPRQLRDKLAAHFAIHSIRVAETATARDKTKKLLLRLSDDNFVEAVVIPAEGRVTGCISSQAGCKYACRFCASGAQGLKRNLTAGEILEEIICLKRANSGELTHIVFMGTGEPFDNYDNVLKAVRIINAKEGFNIGARRITISTAGVIPGIRRLAGEGLQIELSVSLHSADEITRSELMPINKKYPLKELMFACREYIGLTRRQITFEYVLIKGVNSSLQDAQKLSRIVKNLKLAKVNLIVANPVRNLHIEPPGKLEALLFRDRLLKDNIVATLRKSRGADIDASCGQLRLGYEKN